METQPRARVLMMADVGGPTHYHVGDEAILTARLAWMRRTFPGVEPVVLSEDPVFTHRQHGVEAWREPVPPAWLSGLGFHRIAQALPWLARLALRRWLARTSADWRRLPEFRACYLCGGGNLTSTYSRLLELRSFVARLALVHRIPILVTGQQIGPFLTPGDRALLRSWLGRAAFVGVRDAESSVQTCRELGVAADRLRVTGDDALDLEPASVSWPPPELGGRPILGLSLHGQAGAAKRETVRARLTELLAGLSAVVGFDVIFLPHVRFSSPHRCDVQLARDLVPALGAGVRWFIAGENYDDRHIKALTARCDCLITTRFHGAVFALSTGVPVLALSQDAYTAGKFNGLFQYVGLPDRAVELFDPRAASAWASAWAGRGETAARVRAAWAATQPRQAAVHDEVRRVLEGLLAIPSPRG